MFGPKTLNEERDDLVCFEGCVDDVRSALKSDIGEYLAKFTIMVIKTERNALKCVDKSSIFH